MQFLSCNLISKNLPFLFNENWNDVICYQWSQFGPIVLETFLSITILYCVHNDIQVCVWTWPTYAYTSHTCNHTNRIARYTLPKPTTCFKEIKRPKLALTCFNCSLDCAINSTPNSWISKLNSFSHTMCNVMVFSHASVVFMHTYPKVAPNSLQKNLIRPNHTSPCLEFRKLFNVLLSRFGWEASRPAMRNMDRFPSKHMYLFLSMVERRRKDTTTSL